MSIQYGSMYVDEQYKATVLPNLFYKTWLVPVAAAGAVDHHVLIGHARHKPGLIKKVGENSCLVQFIDIHGSILDRHR